MIIKSIVGKDFRGCVNYVLGKKGAELLCSNGVREEDKKTIISDFNTVRALKPSLGNAVWHAPISFAYTDKIDDHLMTAIAQDFINEIGLTEHQYIIVKHNDTRHKHLHIVANRVGFDGKVLNDKFCRNRSAQISDQLELKYGLTIAREVRKGKEIKSLDTSKLKGKALVKRELKENIRSEVDRCLKRGTRTLEHLKAQLILKSIEMKIQYNSHQEVTGVSFRANGQAMKGSLIHSDLRAKKLKEWLDANRLKKSLKMGF